MEIGPEDGRHIGFDRAFESWVKIQFAAHARQPITSSRNGLRIQPTQLKVFTCWEAAQPVLLFGCLFNVAWVGDTPPLMSPCC
jgi:hypothetical protein